MNTLNLDTRQIFAEVSSIYSNNEEIKALYERINYVFDGGINLQGAGLPRLLLADKFQEYIANQFKDEYISTLNVYNVLQFIENVSSAKTLAGVFKDMNNINLLHSSWKVHVDPYEPDVMAAVNSNNNRGPGFLGYTVGYSFLSTVYGSNNIETQLCPLTEITTYPAINQLMEDRGYLEPVVSLDDLQERILAIYGCIESQGELFAPMAKKQMGTCPFGRGTNAIFRCLGEDVKRGNITKWNIFNSESVCGNRNCQSECILKKRNLNNAPAIDMHMQHNGRSLWDYKQHTFYANNHLYNQEFRKTRQGINFVCTELDPSTAEVLAETSKFFGYKQPRKLFSIPAAGVYARDRIIRRSALKLYKDSQPAAQEIALEEQSSISTVNRAIKCTRCLQIAGGAIVQKVEKPLDECKSCQFNDPEDQTNPFAAEDCPLKPYWKFKYYKPAV